MKNFPHQINQIDKLVNALSVIQCLIENQQDVLDDGVLGYALAREYIYTFRNYNPSEESLDERILREQTKPTGNQGARTCARDLRRLFELLGFISIANETIQISNLGQRAINAGNDIGQDEVCNVWREALNDMVVFSENGESSHPYRILIRLVSEFNGIVSKKLSLALEAYNDSEEEFQRILEIASIDNDWESYVEASDSQLKNGAKILPALARQINDIREDQRLNYINRNQVNDQSNEYIVTERENISNRRRTRSSRNVNSSQIATIPTRQDDDSQGENTIDLSQAIRMRSERTERHQHIVRFIANEFGNLGYELYEDPMDCLAVNECNSVLIEAKTLNGQYDDEIKQVRLALGQLLYYEMFNLRELISNQYMYKIALFESQISEEHIRFLETYNCLVLWINNNQIQGSENALNTIHMLGVNCI